MSATEQLMEWGKALEKENTNLRNESLGIKAQMSQMSAFGSEKTNNFAEYQISFDKELNSAYHLLSAHEIEVIDNKEVWVECKDDRLRLFSENGVKRIMNILSFYLTKNTVMSFYDEETIKWKVRDFATELTDLIEINSSSMLYFPTPEQLFERYSKIILKDPLEYANFLIIKGDKGYLDEEKLYQFCLKNSEEELEGKENQLPIMVWAIIDMVHSAYSRAFKGKERDSLGERGIRILNGREDDNQKIDRPRGGFLTRFKG